jgi:predicted SAM-dependent methyltransferase
MRLGLGLHVRAVELARRLGRWWRQRARRPLRTRAAERLHIGCGPQVLPGWFNVDLEAHPGVDLVHDVRDGLPFRGTRYVFAEHFLEHLTYDEGVRFLKECRQALADGGVLRLSTPNLDWVVSTQYNAATFASEEQRLQACFGLNKAFRGWGHQFLYNATTLAATVRAAGFEHVRFFRYGESDDPVLASLERHETLPDAPDLPHVIIVEASGRRATSLDGVRAALDDYDRAVHG